MRERPVRVLHLITDSGTGGAEKILYELVTRIDRSRFDCRVVVMKKPGTMAERMTGSGVEVMSLGLPKDTSIKYILELPSAGTRLYRELKRWKPDILHCWLFQANMLGRVVGKITGVPTIISGLRVTEMEKNIQYPIDRLTSGMTDLYLAVCEAVADHYRKNLSVIGKKMRVIRNGIDPTPYREQDRGRQRKELGLSENEIALGAMGRLHRQKGFDLLINAMAKVQETHPKAVLLIAGEGPQRGDLEKMAAPSGDRVRLVGEQKAEEFLAALDIFVLPSRWEGMPNAVLEAMASGLPVVASRVGGTPEIVSESNARTEAESGILVPPDDIDALAGALNELISSPERREKIGESARSRAEKLFSVKKMVEEYEALYEELSH